MRNPVLLLSTLLLAAAPAAAQTAGATAPPAAAPLRLTADEAVAMAIDNNVDLRAARIDPQIGDARVAAAAGAFRPSFTLGAERNNQLLPPSSFLFPVATRNDVVTSSAGIGQRLPWFGTTYSVGWNAVHTNSNSILNSYNPLLQSGLTLGVSQPLLRDLKIDGARMGLESSRINRDVAGTRLDEAVVHTKADVKSAYWGLVSARANVDARRSALALAEELVRVNKAKVDVGQSPPLDLVSAQAEVAADQEQLIIAETAVRQAEDRLRLLIFDASKPEAWTTPIETADAPPIATAAVDVNAAIQNALRDRTDLARARRDIESATLNEKWSGNQRLPDIRANLSYQASGLGGTQVLRTGGFPGTVVGPGDVTPFADVLGQLFSRDFPTWTAGVSISYPIGRSTEEANYAQAQLQSKQAAERLKRAEARAIQQVRDAAWKIDMNAKRIETTRAARELAEQRLDAERKRFDVGMSTSFLVIQAQRDLAQAKTNELAALLDYDLALVDFEALQQAGPEAAAPAAGAAQSGTAATAAATATPAAAAGPTSAASGSAIPGVGQP